MTPRPRGPSPSSELPGSLGSCGAFGLRTRRSPTACRPEPALDHRRHDARRPRDLPRRPKAAHPEHRLARAPGHAVRERLLSGERHQADAPHHVHGATPDRAQGRQQRSQDPRGAPHPAPRPCRPRATTRPASSRCWTSAAAADGRASTCSMRRRSHAPPTRSYRRSSTGCRVVKATRPRFFLWAHFFDPHTLYDPPRHQEEAPLSGRPLPRRRTTDHRARVLRQVGQPRHQGLARGRARSRLSARHVRGRGQAHGQGARQPAAPAQEPGPRREHGHRAARRPRREPRRARDLLFAHRAVRGVPCESRSSSSCPGCRRDSGWGSV